MRIKVYIVTYNNDPTLKMCLGTLFASDLTDYDYSIHIVNNFGRLQGFSGDNIFVLDNLSRPDHSHGYLARNWNQSLVDGFKDLNHPDCDLVVLLQNDTLIKPQCFSRLIEGHGSYDFIQAGVGDQIMSFNPKAIKNIGLFDERFCKLLHESDYFWSAAVFHKEKSSINDPHHTRVLNPIDSFIDPVNPSWAERTGFVGAGSRFVEFAFAFNWIFYEQNEHTTTNIPSNLEFRTEGLVGYNTALFYTKWGLKNKEDEYSNNDIYVGNTLPLEEDIKVSIDRYFTYPYFEKDILTLKEQRYMFADNPHLIKDAY